MTEFKMRSKGEGAYEIVLDGEDIALKVKHVEFEFPRFSPPLVKLTLMASGGFELDLPDAEVTEQTPTNSTAEPKTPSVIINVNGRLKESDVEKIKKAMTDISQCVTNTRLYSAATATASLSFNPGGFHSQRHADMRPRTAGPTEMDSTTARIISKRARNAVTCVMMRHRRPEPRDSPTHLRPALEAGFVA